MRAASSWLSLPKNGKQLSVSSQCALIPAYPVRRTKARSRRSAGTRASLAYPIRVSSQVGWQLGDVRRNSPRLVHGEHLGCICVSTGFTAVDVGERLSGRSQTGVGRPLTGYSPLFTPGELLAIKQGRWAERERERLIHQWKGQGIMPPRFLVDNLSEDELEQIRPRLSQQLPRWAFEHQTS